MGLFDSWNVKDFNVQISTPTVQPGQMISGNVVFTVTSHMSFRNVTFKLIGREWTHVAVNRSTGKSSTTDHYYGKRNFFKVHVTALGMPKWGGKDWKGTLAPGNYSFPFAVRIPADAFPSSISRRGKQSAEIQYFVNACIDIPFGPDSQKVAPFRVVTAMPLAQALTIARVSQPTFQAARVCCAMGVLCCSVLFACTRVCCCCSRGYTNVSFNFDKDAVVLGQDVSIDGSITVDNSNSNEDTKVIEVRLIQQTSFNAQGYSRVAVTTLASTVFESHVSAGQQGERTFPFRLPLGNPVSPDQSPFACNFKGELITNTYFLSFKSGNDSLGQAEMRVASAVDPTNAAFPVQSDAIMGTTVFKGAYPRFLYAPPPGGVSEIPPQSDSIGPFNSCQLLPIPY